MRDSRLLFLLFALLFVSCGVSGCVGEKCFRQSADGAEREQEPLFVKLAQQVWDCHGECRHHCMLSREVERLRLSQGALNFYDEEPVSVSLSVLNLVMHFFGMLSFYNLVYKKLPLRPDGRTYYEYTILLLVYGMLSMSSWFWSAVFHGRKWNEAKYIVYPITISHQESSSSDNSYQLYEQLSFSYPALLQPLLHEGDTYLAWSLKRSKAVNNSKRVVEVIGKGHMNGVVYALVSDQGNLQFRDLAGKGPGDGGSRVWVENLMRSLVKDIIVGILLWALYELVKGRSENS